MEYSEETDKVIFCQLSADLFSNVHFIADDVIPIVGCDPAALHFGITGKELKIWMIRWNFLVAVRHQLRIFRFGNCSSCTTSCKQFEVETCMRLQVATNPVVRKSMRFPSTGLVYDRSGGISDFASPFGNLEVFPPRTLSAQSLFNFSFTELLQVDLWPLLGNKKTMFLLVEDSPNN